MRITYAELKGKPRILKSLTGLTVTEFEALLPSFGRAWAQFVEAEFEQKKRKRAYGAAPKALLLVLSPLRAIASWRTLRSERLLAASTSGWATKTNSASKPLINSFCKRINVCS